MSACLTKYRVFLLLRASAHSQIKLAMTQNEGHKNAMDARRLWHQNNLFKSINE